jgi:electron transfer flavoprotein beta subunit
MNLLVCIKQVPDPELPFKAVVEGKGWPYVLNPYDEVAVNEAVRIKERAGQGTIIVVTVGPASAEKALRKCLAIGADQAIHVCDSAFDFLNPYATALILSKVIATLKYDIIFCGFRSHDGSSCAVGGIIAEFLNIPVITGVVKLELSVDRQSAIAHRRLEGGNREVVQCRLPAAVTVEKALNEPRCPRIRRVIETSKQEISRLDLESLCLEQERFSQAGSWIKVSGISSRRPPKKTFTPSSDLPPEERMKLLMSGGAAKKGGNVVRKPKDEAAKEILQLLISKNIIS